ncbi:MAG: hypothetical protein PHH04_08600 [Thomasclavelia sp.]|nr:hypothetical protein [Thomasclavelia sp.]
MCTSIVINRNKTIIGWNLDILDMKYKVESDSEKVFIEIYDKNEGWMPLFGVNNRGDFVAMPTCWPFYSRSDNNSNYNIINLDIDLLLKKKTFEEIKAIVSNHQICSVKGTTFQAQLSDRNGNVLQIIPGQGYNYLSKSDYSIMTNFSPIKKDQEKHPWMGLDRYNKALEMIKKMNDNVDADDCFEILKATAQTVCPTVVSMVYDCSTNNVYWCENQKWNNIQKQKIKNLSKS